jgi:VIT1/CCC1 family predicted Fe2+/Mn2+ transporter
MTDIAADTDIPLTNIALTGEDHSFLLQRVQPALTGLMDGSLSTIAPIFAIAIASQNPHYAFIAGLATSFGAAISMAFAEGLSDTGELTGRGHPAVRGAITGVGTFIGGILHTLPFLIPQYHVALLGAAVVVAIELVALAYVRVHFFKIGFLGSILSVTLAGALIAVVSALLGLTG